MPKKEESSKLANLTVEPLISALPELTGNHVEFSEVLERGTDASTIQQSKVEPDNGIFENKTVTTPVLNSTKADMGENKIVSVKPAIAVDSKVVENKLSPTNSAVKAMIYTSRSKSGNKKKNIIASK